MIYWIIASQVVMMTAIFLDLTFPICREFFRLYPWPFTRGNWAVYRYFDFYFGWTPYRPSWFRLIVRLRYYPAITLSVMKWQRRFNLGKLKWDYPIYRAYGKEWP